MTKQQAMSISEKFSVRWKDYHENINHAFGYFGKDTDFADVTLACQDGQQFEAHKVILAASSPFFQSILKINKHSHPIIYMKGINAEDLSAIVEFLYNGETTIYPENLDTFLNLAEELKLKGLAGEEERKKTEIKAVPNSTSPKENYVLENNIQNNADISKSDPEVSTILKSKELKQQNKTSHPKTPKPQTYICNKCPVSFSNETEKAFHKKSAHSVDLHPCDECERKFSRKDKVNAHWKLVHNSGRSPSRCFMCDGVFKKLDKLKKHILSHEKLSD